MQIQVKIIIGTLAFMLTMVLMGYVALREPARLESTTAAIHGRTVENGAELFQNNCTTCHGINGEAQVGCRDANNEPSDSCRGLPLNNNLLLCDTVSARMAANQWAGTKADFIRSTITSGRPWAGMPTWGEEFGGPLAYYQVDQLTAFILNWEEDACQGPPPEAVEWPTSVVELPTGDPANGASLYDRNCQRCHGNVDEPGSNQVGPWLGDIATVGATRIDGYSNADYIYESILNINAFMSPDWVACGGQDPCPMEISTMQATFGLQFTEQDMADVISYMLGSTTFETEGAEIIFERP